MSLQKIIALVSFVAILFEITATRLLSVFMYYHYTSLAVSAALLGGTVGSLIVYLGAKRFKRERLERERLERLLTLLPVLMQLSFLLIFALIALSVQFPFFTARLLAIFHEPAFLPFSQARNALAMTPALVLKVGALYLFLALPFVLTGMIFALVFRFYVPQISRLYAADLFGAGLACVLVIPLLNSLGAINALPLLAALLGLLVWWGRPGAVRFTGIAIALLSVALIGANYSYNFARIAFVRGNFEPNIKFSAWTALSHVAVYPGKSPQQQLAAWGTSGRFRGQIPEQLDLVINNSGYTVMTKYDANDPQNWDFSRFNINSTAYQLLDSPQSLIIGPGGGIDVIGALASGSRHVTAVEMNPLIIKIVNTFGDFTGNLYQRDDVSVVEAEGRSYLARQKEHFDVIQAARVYAWLHPSSGAFTLHTNSLYTVEAFAEFMQALTPGGVFTVSRFVYERESLRFITTMVAAYKLLGVLDPRQHIAVIKERGMVVFLFFKNPIPPAQVAKLQDHCRQKAFTAVYWPGGDMKNFYADYIRADAAQREQIVTAATLDLTPVYDDRPFFNYLLRPIDFWQGRGPTNRITDKAIRTLRAVLAIAFGLLVVVLFLPLVVQKKLRKHKQELLYWGVIYLLLGVGFMLVEVPLINRFNHYLGHPVYSLSVTVCTLLLAGGGGSYFSSRLSSAMLTKVALGAAALILGHAFAQLAIFKATMQVALPLRVLIAMLMIAPLGFTMGMIFPYLLKHMGLNGRAEWVPWAWAINGGASVFGAILGTVLAMNYGFTVTFIIAAAFYLSVAGLFRFLEPRGAP